jgi:hypothetical protein
MPRVKLPAGTPAIDSEAQRSAETRATSAESSAPATLECGCGSERRAMLARIILAWGALDENR